MNPTCLCKPIILQQSASEILQRNVINILKHTKQQQTCARTQKILPHIGQAIHYCFFCMLSPQKDNYIAMDSVFHGGPDNAQLHS